MATAPSNTIEGQVQSAGGTVSIPNDDAHLAISYQTPGGAAATKCGSYSASTNAFVPGLAHAGDLRDAWGHDQGPTPLYVPLVTPFMSKIFSGGVLIQTTAAVLIEK